MAYGQIQVDTVKDSLNNTFAPASSVFRNRLINGQMQIAQRGTSGTSGSGVPTTTATYPSVDRWFAYGTGATVTVAQVAGATNTKNLIQLTGAASVTGAGIGQRIESLNSYDLAGQTVTLSANIANSLLTTVTWTAYYASSSDVWTSSTQIATGSWTVSSTIANYSAQIAIPAAATTGIQIIFSVGAQTSGTFQIGNAQLEVGTNATNFEYRPYGTELALCQRYFQKSYLQGTAVGTSLGVNSAGLIQSSWASANTSSIASWTSALPVIMRTSPTATLYDLAGTSGFVSTMGSGGTTVNGASTNLVVAADSNLMVRMFSNGVYGITFGYGLTAEL
jgi:hypothetical protein